MGVQTRTIAASDGRLLRVHDAASLAADTALPVFWHHGTPGLGEPPQPLLALAGDLGLRLLGHDRPGYGGSDRKPGRTAGDAAADVADIADALGIERYAVMGYSGGGPHALACAAADARVAGAIVLSGIAPRDADGLNYYDGMIASGCTVLRAAEHGEAERRAAEALEYDPEFTATDLDALAGDWGWLGRLADRFTPADIDGAVDDDLAYVRPWNVELDAVSCPVLMVHGTADGIVPLAHGRWLARRVGAELWEVDGAGHVAAITRLPDALRWLARRARP